MSLTQKQRFDILERDHFTCRFCGKQAPETALEIDHVKPKSAGGSDDYANLVTACVDCNRGKGDRQIDLSAAPDWNDLVGKFFHRSNPEDGYVDFQGRIVGQLDGGLYVIQFYEWLMGYPNRITTIHSDDFADGTWSFYADAEAMREAHEYGLGVKPRPAPDRNPPEPQRVTVMTVDDLEAMDTDSAR